MKITVTFEIDADLDGWARAAGGDALTAHAEVVTYLSQLNPVNGQTFLTLASPVRATVDLNGQ